MSNVEPGKAKAAGIVGILILITALVNIICGCIYAGMGAKDGSGLWSGFGVSALYVFVKRTIVPELYLQDSRWRRGTRGSEDSNPNT